MLFLLLPLTAIVSLGQNSIKALSIVPDIFTYKTCVNSPPGFSPGCMDNVTVYPGDKATFNCQVRWWTSFQMSPITWKAALTNLIRRQFFETRNSEAWLRKHGKMICGVVDNYIVVRSHFYSIRRECVSVIVLINHFFTQSYSKSRCCLVWGARARMIKNADNWALIIILGLSALYCFCFAFPSKRLLYYKKTFVFLCQSIPFYESNFNTPNVCSFAKRK